MKCHLIYISGIDSSDCIEKGEMLERLYAYFGVAPKPATNPFMPPQKEEYQPSRAPVRPASAKKL